MNDLTGWTVLIVEDEVDAHEVLTPVLNHYHAAVTSAYTAEEALQKLQLNQPTLAIIDLALPGMDGWELLAAMQAQPRLADIPAIAMTAYHSTSVAQEAISAGFAAYFPKPVNARTFVEDLLSILGN